MSTFLFLLQGWNEPLIAHQAMQKAPYSVYATADADSSRSMIAGTITDREGIPLIGISVELTTQEAEKSIATKAAIRQTITDRSGYFEFPRVPYGDYQLSATHLGYEEVTRFVRVDRSGASRQLTIQMTPTSAILEGIVIERKTATKQAAEQPIRAVIVDAAKAAEQPVTLAELMNRAPGIRIRQSGALGNAVDVSINGFQGNSVQYFRDGIPLEYLGGGYNLNNVPVNLLERAEVYKGVVPVSLGGDALGGAVNLVTKPRHHAQVDLSYEAASFNTHVAHLSAYHPLGKRGFVGIDGFYNYADNDYQVDVEVIDANSNPVPARVPLFHNAYRHYFTEIHGGIKNTGWADELKLSLAYYDIERQSQHPALMTNPYGALMTYNHGFVPSLRYRKHTANGRFAVDQFLSYSQINRSRVDTVKGAYNWYGEFTPNHSIGESPRASLSDIDFNHFLTRTNLSYRIAPRHKLEANVVYNHSHRLGADPYGLRFAGTDIDVLSKKAIYTKQIAGLTWESTWLQGALTNQVTAKYFGYRTQGINGFMQNATDLDQYTTTEHHHYGVGNAVKMTLDHRQFIRASVELTNRLPREFELFGDNDTRAPNFQLEPERSFNANLGYSLQSTDWRFEVGVFYRKTNGMILLVPVQPPFAQYQNLDSVRGYGFDLDAHYQFNKNWNLHANVTWQDNRMVDVAEGVHKWIEGTRLRNTPYFFANAGLNAHYAAVFTTNDVLKPYAHWNFIREFYLNHIPRDKEPQGFLGLWGASGVPVTNIVPDQHLLHVGVNYYFAGQPLTLGFEVKNLSNTKLYDYYKIQRPGRSFHVKLTYSWTR